MPPVALALLPVFPAATALILALFGRRFNHTLVGLVACVGVALSFLVGVGFVSSVSGGAESTYVLGSWLSTNVVSASLALRLDSVAFAMVMLVSGFGFLITLYSIGYMHDDSEVARFFASLNLFVASMLILVLADNLLLIFLGWEGVGVCSYLLIGHYWKDQAVPLAAYRAFFTNRIGDLLFLLGVAFLFAHFGTFEMHAIATKAAGLSAESVDGNSLAAWGALLILGGAFAKSAQAPLHVWLPDAMAGPTPVSALIHAATMVTAGVYLVARLSPLYALFPQIRGVIYICALLTLVIGAVLAVVQFDIKKILAYSTLSNLGLMFLALAADSPGAARLHLFGHAAFKALLFLGAGSVILAAHHEQDVRKLAGVLKHLPITRAAFWIGCIGGVGLVPFLAAGFFSKEMVLEAVAESPLTLGSLVVSGETLKWIITAVEVLSAVYMFRLLGYLESNVPGEAAKGRHGHAPHEDSLTVKLVLGILCVVGLGFGFISAPASFGGSGSGFFAMINGGEQMPEGPSFLHALPAAIVALIVSTLTFRVFSNASKRKALLRRLANFPQSSGGPLATKFFFDVVYEAALFAPLRALGRFCASVVESVAEGGFELLGGAGQVGSALLRRVMNGKIQHYAAVLLAAVFLMLLLLPGR